VRAPFPALSLIAGTRKPAYTAWPIEAGRNFEPARSAYIEWILDVADYVREEFRVRQGKVFLWGHSQGGQFAKMTALLHPDQIASYLSQAGSSVPADMITEDRLADMKSQGVDVWLVHGIGDPSVPASTSTSFAERLKAAGMTVKLFLEEGDHSVNAAMINIGRRWIAEVVKKSP